MATIIRLDKQTRPPEAAPFSPAGLPRRRWRFRPRGLVNLVLLLLLLFNLYVLADGLVRLVKQRRAEAVLRARLAQQKAVNRSLERRQKWMQTDEYLRKEAAKLGLVPPEEENALRREKEPPAESPLKRPRAHPCPPY
ncbi:MAG: septum formation initiator family protein [Bacillota bacterium]